ncbi:MAG: hypothetical protein RL564_906 [Pseudomonadota bacterium]|jgi:hypothetical protein
MKHHDDLLRVIDFFQTISPDNVHTLSHIYTRISGLKTRSMKYVA